MENKMAPFVNEPRECLKMTRLENKMAPFLTEPRECLKKS